MAASANPRPSWSATSARDVRRATIPARRDALGGGDESAGGARATLASNRLASRQHSEPRLGAVPRGRLWSFWAPPAGPRRTRRYKPGTPAPRTGHGGQVECPAARTQRPRPDREPRFAPDRIAHRYTAEESHARAMAQVDAEVASRPDLPAWAVAGWNRVHGDRTTRFGAHRRRPSNTSARPPPVAPRRTGPRARGAGRPAARRRATRRPAVLR